MLVLLLLSLNSFVIHRYSCQACEVTGFKMYLKDPYVPEYASILGRYDSPESMKQNDMICHSGHMGDNIEAITKGCTSSDAIQFSLRNRTNNKVMKRSSDKEASYFLYGNNATHVHGEVLNVGKYRLFAGPNLSSTKGRKSISFEVMNCMYYKPANECATCAKKGQVCAGSMCVDTGTVRVTLLATGPNTWDYGMNVTTPGGAVIASYSQGHYEHRQDPTTGGYVSVDHMLHGCKSMGMWVKNVVLKTPTPGKYTISLEDVNNCAFLSPNPPLSRSYQLLVYKNEVPIATTVVDAGARIFSFDVSV